MNKTLISGAVITAFMIAIAVLGPALAPYGLDHQVKLEYIVKPDGSTDFLVPPVPPGPGYLLGTDIWGYDLLTKLLYGARYTLFLSISVALARVAIGGLAGMLLGVLGREKKGWPVWSVLSGIPLFIIVWFVLIGISFNSPLEPWKLSAIIGVILSVVGLPGVAVTVKEKTAELKKRPFVLASRSVGAGHWRIIKNHLFPHLRESLLVLFVNEIILTLTLFGQLGLFHIFVGGTAMNFDPPEYFTRTNEWAGLISTARNGIYVYRWILLIPLAAYVTLIIGFYCISKGLEGVYREKISKAAHV